MFLPQGLTFGHEVSLAMQATMGPALHPSRVHTTDHPARARQGALLMTAMSDETEGGGSGGAREAKGWQRRCLGAKMKSPGKAVFYN